MGRALAERLRAQGAEVRGVDLAADPAAGVVAGDTSRGGDWEGHVEGCDVVVHTAALVSLRGDARRFWEVNVLGTRNVLDAARAAGVRRFVHISSVVAFGYEFPAGVDERHPVRTTGSPYVDTKVAGEQVVLAAHAAGELECTIVRPGDVYGPRGPQWTVLPVELIRAHRIALPARGRGIFSPVYIGNLVEGIAAAAGSDAAAGQVFTLTDGRAVTTRDYFGRYAAMLGMRPPPGVPNALALPASWLIHHGSRLAGVANELNPDAIRYLSRTGTYSIEKARRLLGYSPAVSLEEGLERTERWLREEGLVQ